MNKQFLLGSLLVIAPFATLPMGWLTNNSLTNKLAFLNSMRFTRPLTQMRQYYSKDIQYLNSNKEHVSNKLAKPLKEIREIAESKESAATKFDRTKQLHERADDLDYLACQLRGDLNIFKDNNDTYNAIDKKYKDATKNQQYGTGLKYLEELNNQSKKISIFKKNLETEYKFKFSEE